MLRPSGDSNNGSADKPLRRARRWNWPIRSDEGGRHRSGGKAPPGYALLRLYENDDTPEPDAPVFAVTRRQLCSSKSSRRLTAEHRQLLESRLATADRLAENPAAAQSLWRSIVLLYDRRPWAETEVALARQRLAASESGNCGRRGTCGR